jgi:hypothetical protein
MVARPFVASTLFDEFCKGQTGIDVDGAITR